MPTQPPPLTSIVVLTRNELAYTRRCIESIARCTPEPHELVFVDNASSDGTLDYLRSLPAATTFVIDNDRNLGFGAGCNQGIAAARGDRVLLLNNDVVVTPGWLAALHRTLDASDAVGIAGPRSNRVAGAQQVDVVGYDTAEEETLPGLDAWAAEWCAAHAGRTTPTARLIGFCLLVERAVVDRIGGFDLRYGLGNFEDDDLCLRAGVAGFECRIAHDSFIHHYGSRTFTGERIDYTAALQQNLRRFATAWRMEEGDMDPATGAYFPDRLLARTSFDAARHHAPLVAVPDELAVAQLDGARSRVVGVCCDRLDPAATRAALDAALTRLGPADDVTVAVRIDPRDAASMALLEETADRVGDDALPDIVVVPASDEHDGPILRACDVTVVAPGRFAAARRMLAASLGAATCAPDELAPGTRAAA